MWPAFHLVTPTSSSTALNIYVDLQGFTTTTTAEGSAETFLRVPAATTRLNYEGMTITMVSQTITMSGDGQDNRENY